MKRDFGSSSIPRTTDPFRTDSGYSVAAKYLVDGLHRDLDLAVFAPVGGKYKLEYYFPDLGLIGVEPTFGFEGGDEKYYIDHVVPIYPGISEDYGENIVEEHYQDFFAEILFQIADAWPLSRIPDLARGDRVRWIIQPPVDFLEPIPPYVVDRLRPAMHIVPWVEDGKERLVKAGLTNVSDPIPLGVNCDLWSPRDRTKYPPAMDNLGFGYDTYNIAMVAANQYGRKAWEQSLRGIKLFMEKRPDVHVRLYIHTQMNIADGWDMPNLLGIVGLADVTKNAKPYELIIGRYTEFQLMLIHALADVVLNAGLEGFGYSTVQSQAVGTPIIGLNAGATKELVQSGILVPPYTDILTQNFLRRTDPHPVHIAEALERVYETPRPEFTKGVQFVRENFAWPIIIEKWRKFFQEVDQELERKCIKSGRYPPAPSERAIELSNKVVQID